MELREYLHIISKRIGLLVIVILVVTLGTYLFTVNQPKSYDASAFVNVVVKQPTGQTPDYYQYDNYYSLQASSLFADTIMAWLQDPSNVMEIYNNAKLAAPEMKLKNLSKLIKARKKNPATVQITLNNRDQTVVENLINATVQFIQNKTDFWSKEGLFKDFYIDSSRPVVVESKPSVLSNTVMGLVAGIILGLAAVFFTDYMKKEK